MKAIVYCRVSTKEQAEKGYSLESQEQDCKKFAINQGYKIDKIFIEKGESAKTQQRTELQNLIKYCIINKKEISFIIVWKFDRFARNLLDQLELMKQFSILGIRVLSATENNEQTSVGKLMRNIMGAFAQYENDLRAERTTKGMQQAVKEGRWCWRPPVGYNISRDENNKPILVKNNHSEYIVDAFKLAENGFNSQTEIVRILNQKGFKVNRTLLGRILHNPLYAGMIKVDWFSEYFDAIHEPLISKELFFKVMNQIDNKRVKIDIRRKINPDFPLKSFIICGQCYRNLTAGWFQGKRKKYPYYVCQSRCFNISKYKLEDQFIEILEKLQPSQKVLKLFKLIIVDVYKERRKDYISIYNRMKKELDNLEKKKKRINEMAVDGFFDKEEYKNQIQNVNTEIQVKTIEMNENKIDTLDIDNLLNFAQYFLSNTSKLWINADIETKIKIQKIIFTDKLIYDGNKYQTPLISPLFSYLQEISDPKYCMVAPRGIEPLLPE